MRMPSVRILPGISFQHPAICPTRHPRQSLSVDARQKFGRRVSHTNAFPRTV